MPSTAPHNELSFFFFMPHTCHGVSSQQVCERFPQRAHVCTSYLLLACYRPLEQLLVGSKPPALRACSVQDDLHDPTQRGEVRTRIRTVSTCWNRTLSPFNQALPSESSTFQRSPESDCS